MRSTGIIVDGYSSGAGFAKEFSKRGIPCIHIQSQQTIPKVYSHTYNPQDYIAECIYQKNIDSLLEYLNTYNIKFVIAGAECGVELADLLADKLDIAGNKINLSFCRRNKHLMIEQVRTTGIQVIPSYRASTLNEAVRWASTQKQWPLVVKPLTSAGGEGVFICQTLNEVKNAYLEIMETKTNMLGFSNHAALIQTHIEGEEFVVNTVSCAGVHKLCELWRYSRYKTTSGHNIYNTAHVIDFDREQHTDIVNYAMKVLEALGIQYGPAHVEIIKNENGCYLIELGARLMGANLPFSLLSRCISTPQAILSIESFINPVGFRNKLQTRYQIFQPITVIFMVSNQNGVIRKINFIDKIRKLKSFFDIKLAVKIGSELKATVDYQTSPGMIYLTHADRHIIESDKKIIRKIEQDMFELAPLNMYLDRVLA